MDYSDFHKATGTARMDYRFSNKTNLSNSVTLMNYYSDMPSGVDSIMFATRKFTNPQTFTYRKVEALRYHSTLTQNWNQNSRTTVSAVFRKNSIGQNPNYRIKDDYKKTGNTWSGSKDLAHGEINKSSFHSYVLIAQHRRSTSHAVRQGKHRRCDLPSGGMVGGLGRGGRRDQHRQAGQLERDASKHGGHSAREVVRCCTLLWKGLLE
jgi:hypothetical protein